MSRRTPHILIPIAVIAAVNAAILGVAALVRQSVLPAWVKGPLIDPATPYSPENAQWLFAVGFCIVFDIYVLLLAVGGRRLGRKPWLPWVGLALALMAGEGTLSAWLSQHPGTYFRPHPTLHWVVRPNLDHYYDKTSDTVISTNRHGMREAFVPVQKPEGVQRVLVLGDSSNFGNGVSGDQMWEAVLQDLLARTEGEGRIQVLNASCPGWTTWQGLEVLESWGWDYQPDLVIAGFNNDPGPDYFTDRERVVPTGWRRTALGLGFHSELFLLGREATLSLIRRLSPEARARYAERHAGEKPRYGKLDGQHPLVRRVPLEQFKANLIELDSRSKAHHARFVWIDMPINRSLPDLVQRYVSWDYRDAAIEVAASAGIPVVEVDGTWARWGIPTPHIHGHVFHPNAPGHHALAEQVNRDLLAGQWLQGLKGHATSPPLSLRLGWSSLTPVHAHVGAVLTEHPELATQHGVVLQATSYASGKKQGRDVRDRSLDAFFTCEVPAVHMLSDRPDVQIVASPGALGRIAVVARAGTTLDDLRGGRVGVASGSTPDMDWQTWGKGLSTATVKLRTEDLLNALLSKRVDAIVSWDPWVQSWQFEHPGELSILDERPFYSVLGLSEPWAALHGRDQVVALIEDALRVAAADRPHYDAEVARLSGWPIEVVKAVADRNAILSGQDAHMDVTQTVVNDLRRASSFAGGAPIDPHLPSVEPTP